MSVQAVLSAARRIHLLEGEASVEEAARFLVASLLLSHGIRRDTVALVIVDGSIIVAPGSRLRHLRPDMESAAGWVRAVLYKGKARGLGALVLRAEARDLRGLAHGAARTVLHTCRGPRGIASQDLVHPLLVVHSASGRSGECWLSAPCSAPCRAALSNIVLDRVEASLPGLA